MSTVLCIMHVGRYAKEQEKGENKKMGETHSREEIPSICESISHDRR